MKFGFVLPKTINIEDVNRFAQKVEELGFESVWVADHIVLPIEQTNQYPYTEDGKFTASHDDPQLDAFVLLSILASATSKVAVGTSVIIVPYRNPIVQAKMFATLDVLSRGRVLCGVGVGWLREEFEALGASYQDRGAVTDEYLQVFKSLWSSNRPQFNGEHYQFSDVGFAPKPVRGNIPIWVGGHTRRAVRRAVKYGDAWHPTRQTPERVASMVPYLHSYCDEHGRERDEIVISLKRTLHFTDIGMGVPSRIQSNAALINSTEGVVEDVYRCEELGIKQLTFDFQTSAIDDCMKTMEHFAGKVM